MPMRFLGYLNFPLRQRRFISLPLIKRSIYKKKGYPSDTLSFLLLVLLLVGFGVLLVLVLLFGLLILLAHGHISILFESIASALLWLPH